MAAVAIDANTVVVGAWYQTVEEAPPTLKTRPHGATHGQVANLTASDAAVDDNFGFSVAIAGDPRSRAPDHNGERGAVYVFSMVDGGTTYSQEVKLTASDAATNDYFGCSVAIDGNTVVVKPSTEWPRLPARRWYHVRRVAELTADDAAEDDRFGWSVAIKNNTVVVGAYYYDDDNR